MKDEFEEKARELVENWQKDPWPEQLVQDIAKARQAEYLRGRESMRAECAKVAEEYCPAENPLTSYTQVIADGLNISKAIRSIEL